jgi:hypothetical protein
MDQQEIWQVEVAGTIYETDFAGLTQWIAESSLLPEDKIKRGDMPWIAAKFVPALTPYFAGEAPVPSANAVTSSENFTPAADTAEQVNAIVNEEAPVNFGGTAPHTSTGFASPYQTEAAEPKTVALPPGAPIAEVNLQVQSNGKCCALHPVREATFACRQCLSLFCPECPQTIAKVRICPLCGDMCNPFGAGQAAKNTSGKPDSPMRSTAGPYVDPNFSLADFTTAWAYPFKFPVALILGGVITSLLGLGVYLGLVTASFGGLFPGLMTMLVCAVLCAAIVYGCATKAVKQVAYGDMNQSFAPDTEDFSIWGTILLPCFLGLGTCIVSWGPVVLVGLIIFKTFMGGVSDAAKQIKPPAPEPLQSAMMAPDGGFGAKDPLQKEIEGNSRTSETNAIKRIQNMQKTVPASPFGLSPAPPVDQKAQAAATEAVIKKLMPRLIPLVLLFILALLWGIFYFPTALTVAGYTESIGSTMNPLVGFGMMRQMGSTYFKAFGMYVLLLVMSFVIYGVVLVVTTPLAEAGLGQVPANFIANIISFYLYLVIACIFGRALYRSHEKIGFSVTY